jgi:hypothetical protein
MYGELKGLKTIQVEGDELRVVLRIPVARGARVRLMVRAYEVHGEPYRSDWLMQELQWFLDDGSPLRDPKPTRSMFEWLDDYTEDEFIEMCVQSASPFCESWPDELEPAKAAAVAGDWERAFALANEVTYETVFGDD